MDTTGTVSPVLRAWLSRPVVGAVLALPSPILAGDWPDPSAVRDGNETVAVTTAGGAAPIFRVLRSPDLRTWRIAGSVFRRPPRWAKTDFWAPEITRLSNGRWAVFYSALPRNRSLPGGGQAWLCLGVATAPAPEGPWRDLGKPLRCNRNGSIDPYPTRDERGHLYLLWKEDGNEFKLPTPIFAQKLREDGLRLVGRPRELIRNNRRWEKNVVEAPHVERRGDWFYLLYSANLCCTRKCAYAIGVARSRRLLGPWRKFSGNPILRGGNGWSCPGHATVIGDGAGGSTVLFHAYRRGAGRIAGRQLLAAPFTIAADGWPRIGAGRPPAPALGAAATGFTDAFTGPAPAIEWEWPFRRVPGMRTGDGLRLRASGANRRRLDGGVLFRRVGTERYTATAIVDGGSLGEGVRAGIASYRSSFEAIGIAVGRRDAVVWRRRKGRFRQLRSILLPGNEQEHLRMIARGNSFRFDVSPDGVTYRTVGRGFLRGPIEESARFGLTVGGVRRARARFISAGLAE